jgi:Peptidase S46
LSKKRFGINLFFIFASLIGNIQKKTEKEMKKLLLILIVVSISIFKPAKADEGMWLPLLVERLNYVDMQKMGLQLTPEEIYSVNHSSIKDAIVIFGRGCTGEIISDQGLLLTNHHCGYGQIQSHSSVQNDYLSDGFWAMNKGEELANPGLTAKFLVKIEDVTGIINAELNYYQTEDERDEIIKRLSKEIVDEATEGNNYEASVKGFFEGSEFYLFVYETYKDVRLVGAPPSSIGKFGADTDNWMWPRHTGDFSLFRVYTAPDGSPAEYSEDNIPMKPKYHLPISTAGYDKDDFTFIMGYPGSTDRYLPSAGVKMALEIVNPAIVKIRDKKIKIMRADMDADPKVKIQYASKYAQTTNYWKYYIGQSKGLVRNDVFRKKQNIESKFEAWVMANTLRQKNYGKALANMSNAFAIKSKYALALTYFREAIYRGNDLIVFAFRFTALYDELKKEEPNQDKIKEISERLKGTAEAHFKNYNQPTDKKLFSAMLSLYFDNVSKQQQPDIKWYIDKTHKGCAEAFTNEVFEKSVFVDKDKVMAFLDSPDLKTFEKDLAFETMQSFFKNYRKQIELQREADDMLARGKRDFIQGIREINSTTKYYPDANFTMRLTYGKILSYEAADAVDYKYYTTLAGVIEKEDPDNWEFVVPARLKELYESKDYGDYGQDGEMITCFLSNNDITGGNSGSPVINGWGELIGIAFDGNWEAMSGDIVFEPEQQRCINVDIRYVLFVIDKYAGASHLVDEMTIVKTKHPKPVIEEEKKLTPEEELEILKGRG